MLALEGLRLELGDFRLSADWALPPGVTAVLGPSGGGKSTLLAAIAGFVRPVAGRILWHGKHLAGLGPDARPVATVFQDQNLFPHLTVAQNVGLGLRPDLRAARAFAPQIAEVLARVGLEGMEARRPGTLSGGQQSRAALARVLVMDRPVVLLDEPFSALGPGLRAEMLALVGELLEGRTVLMVTHDPADAERIAERIVVVDGGVAAPPVPADELLSDPPPALRRYFGR